jgi:hypothetical protein
MKCIFPTNLCSLLVVFGAVPQSKSGREGICCPVTMKRIIRPEACSINEFHGGLDPVICSDERNSQRNHAEIKNFCNVLFLEVPVQNQPCINT